MLAYTTGPPTIIDHPMHDAVPIEGSITLMCRAKGLGIMYSWEIRHSDSSWTSIENAEGTSYTTNRSVAVGQYMYRCNVSNEAGSVVSDIATVNVYGEYCPNR